MKKRKNGFTLVELLAVLVILALLILLAGSAVIRLINGLEKDDDSNELYKSRRKTVENAAEQWSLDNLDKFDDVEGKKITVGLDVVFLLDFSGSMNSKINGSIKLKSEGMIDALNEALKILRENDDNRVGYVAFSGQCILNSSGNCINGNLNSKDRSILAKKNLTPVSQLKDLTISCTQNSGYECYVYNLDSQKVKVVGGTYTQLGIQTAAEMLMNADNSKGRIPVIILLTDGEPSVGIDDQTDFLAASKEVLLQKKNANVGTGVYTWCLSSETHSVKSTYYSGSCINTSHSAEEATKKSSIMLWNVISSAKSLEKYISDSYGTDMYFYTIGLGLTSKLGQFIINPNSENLANLSTSASEKNSIKEEIKRVEKKIGLTTAQCSERIDPSKYSYSQRVPYNTKWNENFENLYDQLWHLDIGAQLYNDISKKQNYNYVKGSFNTSSLDELTKIFKQIAQDITEATKVTTVCVTLDELLRGGYLNDNAPKNLKIKESDLKNHYVRVSIHEATKQYGYHYLNNETEQELVKECKQYIDAHSGQTSN